jgi:arylsulfatase A-like enzyme
MPLTTPNLVLVLLDDLEDDLLSDTRCLPWLATEPGGNWITFPNSIISTPLCGPHRANWITGLRDDHHRLMDHTGLTAGPVPYAIQPNPATQLAAVGYQTGYFGKVQNGWPHGDFATHDPGFDKLLAGSLAAYTGWTLYREDGSTVTNSEPYHTDRIRNEAVSWVEGLAAQPFMLFFSPNAPHRTDPGDTNPTPADRHVGVDAGGITAADDPGSWNTQIANAPSHMLFGELSTADQDAFRSSRADARRSLLAVDEALEAIWDAVAARGWTDNTVWMIWTDNGIDYGRHRIPPGHPYKLRPYRWCVNANLRVRYPGVASRTESKMVSTLDLPATWRTMAGAPVVISDGRSFAELIGDPLADVPSAVEAHCVGNIGEGQTTDVPEWWAIYTRRWSYHHWVTDDEELFDLRADPDQLTNVAGDAAHADEKAWLSRRLDWMTRVPRGRR